MAGFQQKFFVYILKKEANAKENLYLLTAFTSSLYIAGLPASLVASWLTANFGRKFTIMLGGCTFLLGGAINGGAENIAMLILGRVFMGFGLGFTNQAAPVYPSEVAPPRWRGVFTTGFEIFINVGILFANCINYGMAKLTWGWRLSLGLAFIPALIMTLGAVVISDTPSSLANRGMLDQAKKALIKAGGDADVEVELAELVKAGQAARAISTEPFITIFAKHNRPYLIMAILIPSFQQLTGINAIVSFAPALFESVGFGSTSALIAAIILGLFILGSNLLSTHGAFLFFAAWIAIMTIFVALFLPETK
ncbi:Sugar transport protein 5-like protein, partial [Drosera capensis]